MLVADFPKWYVFSLNHLHAYQWLMTSPSPVGWILSLRKIGDTFNGNEFFYVWNIVMTIWMCLVWLILIVLTTTAFCQGKIFISPREETVKDSILHMKLRRHVEDLELGQSRYTSQTVTPQAQSPRVRSRSASHSGSCAGMGMVGMSLSGRTDSTLKKFNFARDSPPSDSGMSTPREVSQMC